jgi:hypothetical protein
VKRRATAALVLLLGGCARTCAGAAPPAEAVEIYVVDAEPPALSAGDVRAPFPARLETSGSAAYWQIPRDHEEALRAFAAELRAPAGRVVLVGPSAREGFSRTYMVVAPPRIGRSCVASMQRSGSDTTIELTPPCAKLVGGLDAALVLAVDGKVIAPPFPGSAFDGARLLVETADPSVRN